MQPRTAEALLAGILANQLRRIEFNYDGAREGSDPERLHDLRVAIRRARFALRLFAPFVDSAKCHKIRESLAGLNSKSSEVRDLDISIGRLKILFIKHRMDTGIRNKIFRELLERHKQARHHMLKALTSSCYEETISSISGFIKELKEKRSGSCKGENIGRIFNKLTRVHADKLSNWGNWSSKDLSSKDLHKMRIDFKRARYLMEFLSACNEAQKSVKKYETVFESLQDILGKHQDSMTVIKNVREASEKAGLDDVDIKKIVKSEKKRAKKSRTEFESRWEKLRRRRILPRFFK